MEREGRQGRRTPFVWFWFAALVALWPLGCSQNAGHSTAPPGTPNIRVLLLESQQQVNVSATTPPVVHVGPSARTLNFPANTAIPVSLTPAGWQIGAALLGPGEMLLQPASDGSVQINKT